MQPPKALTVDLSADQQSIASFSTWRSKFDDRRTEQAKALSLFAKVYVGRYVCVGGGRMLRRLLWTIFEQFLNSYQQKSDRTFAWSAHPQL